MAVRYRMKTLQAEEKKLNREIGKIDKQLKILELKKNKLKKYISSNAKKQQRAIQAEVIVSEHSIIRYLERVEQMDMKKVADKILNKATIRKIKQAKGYGEFNRDNFRILVRDYLIVTVIN